MHGKLIALVARCGGARVAAGAGVAAQAAAGLGAAIELVDPKVFRVCADPHNMPFSNEAEEGYEQKLAELLRRASSARPCPTPTSRRSSASCATRSARTNAT